MRQDSRFRGNNRRGGGNDERQAPPLHMVEKGRGGGMAPLIVE